MGGSPHIGVCVSESTRLGLQSLGWACGPKLAVSVLAMGPALQHQGLWCKSFGCEAWMMCVDMWRVQIPGLVRNGGGWHVLEVLRVCNTCCNVQLEGCNRGAWSERGVACLVDCGALGCVLVRVWRGGRSALVVAPENGEI